MKRMPWVWMIPLALLAAGTVRAAEPANLATGAKATASSTLDKYKPENAIDGVVADDASRWVSTRTAGPHWLELTLAQEATLAGAHLYSGWGEQDAIKGFRLEAWDGAAWQPIAVVKDNTQVARAIAFEKPVKASRLRLFSDDAGPVRVKELALFAPAPEGLPKLGAGVKDSVTKAPPDPKKHFVFVNQCGYNAGWPKRFTAPHAADGTRFVITAKGDTKPVSEGTLAGGVGDFSKFEPAPVGGVADPAREFVIRISSAGMTDGVSDPFLIEPGLLQKVALDNAVRFMQDARSVVGSHASAYGGGAFRDSTYYTFEMPSLVLLYLSDPAYFDGLKIEIDANAEKQRILDPAFKLASKDPNDSQALPTARRYFSELDAPVGDRVPDIIRVIHWGVGYYMLDPEQHDPSQDPLGNRLHSQTIEQLAFFLYGYPAYKQYISDKFYAQVRDFTFQHWEKAKLFDVDKTIGDYKGRHCPGHSIMPNLMMHEVARREGRADAGKYLDAAVAQAAWVVESLDPADPMITKGQRMSEHKLVPALVMLLKQHPDRAPKGLKAWIEKWADVVIARSKNQWDFRRYSDEFWTLPKRTPGGTAGVAGGAGWNEPGNLAAFPASAIAAASVLDDKAKGQRLIEIGIAQVDNLFGRNPLGAHTAHNAVKDYPGAERGWPKKFPDNVCARLERVRGTINSSCANEHYPFNPAGDFRHPEGWTAFNAAFNVGLAYLNLYEHQRLGQAKGFGLLRAGEGERR